jgi:chromosome segregation ATPase
MAKGAAPSQDQLLELLKRAAEELKHAQEEARTAIAALQKEQAAHHKTEQELEVAQKQAKGAKSQQSTDEQLLKDQIDAERENGKTLAARVKELEKELQGASTERDALRQRVADGDTAINVANQQEEAKRQELEVGHAAALDTLKTEHAAALEAANAEHAAALDTLKTEHAAALEAAHAEKAELEVGQKASLDDAAGKMVAMETQLVAEKDKHQTTAQKLLETRSKVRELESQLSSEQERVKGLEAAAKQMADEHEKQLHDATDSLSADLHQTQTELQRVTEAWQQVERQYEALHREMLMTLEQRDDARRLLDNERAERERLSRALQGTRT